MPHLILLNGLPASGKSTFGRLLSERSKIPLVSKDYFKEMLGDELGVADVDSSRRYGKIAYRICLEMVESVLMSGGSCILESIFRQEDERIFLELVARYGATPLQIQLVCDGETLFRRFAHRFETGQRHRVQLEHFIGTESFRETLLSGTNYELSFTPVFLKIDSTDIQQVDWPQYIEQIISILK